MKKTRYDSDNGPRPVPKILFFLSESLTEQTGLTHAPRSRVQRVISPLSFSMPTSARISRVASPQDSAVIGFELETARSQAEALTTTPTWLCEFSQFGLTKYQLKQVHGGGTGGGAGGCDFDRRFFYNGNNGPFQVWPAHIQK